MNLKDTFDLPGKFWLATLIAFINSVSFTIIIPSLYPYAKAFGLSDFEASLLTTAYAASQFLGTPILGRLSDAYGRKPLLVLSLLGTVLANIMAAIAPTAGLLYLARVLDGITGGNTSIARAVISDVTTPEQRPKAFGIFGATFRLGFVAGPALSYLAQTLPTLPGVSSLGMSFVVSAGIALVATLLCLLLLPETSTPDQGFRLSWQDFGLKQLATSLADPQYGRLYLLTFLSGGTFTIFTFAFQPFFLKVLEQDAKMLALTFAMVGILGFISQVFGLEPLRRRYRLISILSGTLLLRGGLFLLMPALPNPLIFYCLMGLFGLVNAFPLPLIDAMISMQASQASQGEVLGTNSAYLSISNAIGPAIAGRLVSISYAVPFWVAGLSTILTAGFAATLVTPQKPT